MRKLDFSVRSDEPEIMDDLDLEGDVLRQTLKEITRINLLLGGNEVTLNGIKSLLAPLKPTKPVRILDIGCGDGEILRIIARWGRKRQVPVELIGIDANEFICSVAEESSKDYPEISFQSLDIFSDKFKAIDFDIVTATLVMHHFSNNQLDWLINHFSKASIGVVINDLHRHWFAFHSINLLTAIFSRSSMVKNDAGVSVLRAFRKQELQRLMSSCGVNIYSLKWFWAFRWQLIWKTNVDTTS